MSASRPTQSTQVLATVGPVMIAVFMSFFVVGVALPVLPLHVHNGLGLSTFAVGLVTGSQFAASLISRLWAGPLSDAKGGKYAVLLGLAFSVVAGLIYLVSLSFTATPWVSAAILLVGRAVLGCAESLVITGGLAWGLALVDDGAAGRVISWLGTAMHGAFAVGAPVGSLLYGHFNFTSIALATIGLPLVAAALAARVRGAISPRTAPAPSMRQVIRTVATPGFALAFSSIGMGVMTGFVTLLSSQKGWAPVWVTYSCFALSFIIARAILGALPDRVGGAKIALIFVLIEAAGQAMIWLSPNIGVAIAGAIVSGVGYSLVYPGLGLIVVGRVAASARGTAMGTYTAFLDLALGIATPVLGLLAGWTSLSVIFLFSAICSVLCAVVCARLMVSTSPVAAQAHS